MKALAEAAAALLGGTLQNAQPVHGGCLSEIVRITLSDGREAIVKGGGAPRRGRHASGDRSQWRARTSSFRGN